MASKPSGLSAILSRELLNICLIPEPAPITPATMERREGRLFQSVITDPDGHAADVVSGSSAGGRRALRAGGQFEAGRVHG
jgi:hypothetical protein